VAKNWKDHSQQSFQQPETSADAVNQLMTILEGEHKLAIASMQKDELINLYFSLGIMIRNAFGLHEPDSPLLASCGTVHPDDASDGIVQALWNRLRSSPEAQVH
jgi:hypothetical protein